MKFIVKIKCDFYPFSFYSIMSILFIHVYVKLTLLCSLLQEGDVVFLLFFNCHRLRAGVHPGQVVSPSQG